MMHEQLVTGLPIEHIRGAAASNAIIGSFLAAIAAISSQTSALPTVERAARPVALAAPVPPPLLLRDIAPDEAEKVNRAIPFSTDPNPPAAPFRMSGDRASMERAIQCLATAIYYEAGDEPLDGRRAVAQVVLNRVRHPAFVHSVCGVIYQGSTQSTGCQFSFTCDGSMNRIPDIAGWKTARAIAAAALRGSVFKSVGYATHYHADYVVPYWASSIAKNAVVGRHIFYRWPQWWGTPAAFTAKYTGVEADPRLLRATALLQARDIPTDEAPVAPLPQEASERGKSLLGIIQILAARSSDNAQQGDYERAVNQYFARYSDHVAVQIYRQLSAEKGFNANDLALALSDDIGPAGQASVAARDQGARLAGFQSTVSDFVKQADFDRFFRLSHPSAAAATAQSVTCNDCAGEGAAHASGR